MSDNLIRDADSVSELPKFGSWISYLYTITTCRTIVKLARSLQAAAAWPGVHSGDSYLYTITKQETILKLPTGPAHAPGGPLRGPGQLLSLFHRTCKYKLQVHDPPCLHPWIQILVSNIRFPQYFKLDKYAIIVGRRTTYALPNEPTSQRLHSHRATAVPQV